MCPSPAVGYVVGFKTDSRRGLDLFPSKQALCSRRGRPAKKPVEKPAHCTGPYWFAGANQRWDAMRGWAVQARIPMARPTALPGRGIKITGKYEQLQFITTNGNFQLTVWTKLPIKFFAKQRGINMHATPKTGAAGREEGRDPSSLLVQTALRAHPQRGALRRALFGGAAYLIQRRHAFLTFASSL